MKTINIFKSILWLVIAGSTLAFSIAFYAFVAFTTSDIQKLLSLIALKNQIELWEMLP